LLEEVSTTKSAVTKSATPFVTAELGSFEGITLVQTLVELTLKNIPSASPPRSLLISVFDLPKRFLNAIFAWLFGSIPAIVIT
jgi:hypothetical protein